MTIVNHLTPMLFTPTVFQHSHMSDSQKSSETRTSQRSPKTKKKRRWGGQKQGEQMSLESLPSTVRTHLAQPTSFTSSHTWVCLSQLSLSTSGDMAHSLESQNYRHREKASGFQGSTAAGRSGSLKCRKVGCYFYISETVNTRQQAYV